MDVLRQYHYLIYGLTGEIKINKPERTFSYKVKFERIKLKQKAMKKEKSPVKILEGSEVLHTTTKRLFTVFAVFPLYIN